MAIGVGCWIPHGRRAQAGAACTQGRAGGGEGQSQALVPHFNLQPTCSCRDEDVVLNQRLHGMRCPTAQPCCAVPVENTGMKPFVFERCFVKMH